MKNSEMQTLLREIAFLLGEESQETGEQIISLSSGSFRASKLPEKGLCIMESVNVPYYSISLR